jgi:sensor histidine kinase YesM
MMIMFILLLSYYYDYYFTIIIIIIIVINIIIIHILTILSNNCQTIFSLFRIVKNTTLLPLLKKKHYSITLPKLSLFQSYSLICQTDPVHSSCVWTVNKWAPGKSSQKPVDVYISRRPRVIAVTENWDR